MILLSCRPHDSLQWDESSFPAQGPILWRFDLGLEDPFFPIDDEMHFESLSIALKKFSSEIWPKYQERTTGAILYSGSADFYSTFSWSDKQKGNWDVWKEGKECFDEIHLCRLFTADAFSHYFQMLAHRLPDELPLFLLLDAEGTGSLAQKHQLLSRERFEHFQIATKGLGYTNGLLWEGDRIVEQKDKFPRALCFPVDRMCKKDVLVQLDALIERIEKPFRVISEAFLTEDWEGVDVLYVLEGTLSAQGERKIQGFRATGGSIVY